MSLATSELERIVRANVPVVCLDTCSVLDVVRDPFRDMSLPHDAAAAATLLQALEVGPNLVGLLAEQVQLEIGGHFAEVTAEAERGLRKLRAHVARVDGLVRAFGGTASTDLSAWDQHLATASSVAQRWAQASTAVPQSPSVPNQAYLRVMRVKAPARKGKDSLQDCVVLETYLEAVGELRRIGLATPVVFLSSNTADYGESSTKRSQLHPELIPEFAALNMHYAAGFGMARVLLGL